MLKSTLVIAHFYSFSLDIGCFFLFLFRFFFLIIFVFLRFIFTGVYRMNRLQLITNLLILVCAFVNRSSYLEQSFTSVGSRRTFGDLSMDDIGLFSHSFIDLVFRFNFFIMIYSIVNWGFINRTFYSEKSEKLNRKKILLCRWYV